MSINTVIIIIITFFSGATSETSETATQQEASEVTYSTERSCTPYPECRMKDGIL